MPIKSVSWLQSCLRVLVPPPSSFVVEFVPALPGALCGTTLWALVPLYICRQLLPGGAYVHLLDAAASAAAVAALVRQELELGVH